MPFIFLGFFIQLINERVYQRKNSTLLKAARDYLGIEEALKPYIEVVKEKKGWSVIWEQKVNAALIVISIMALTLILQILFSCYNIYNLLIRCDLIICSLR
jgi:hypothetical protein